ncbi:hypothetical protein OD91_0412 [Lutibacter sp. Hel_I_33_5]|uniref:hypothetical protein n=1 Tax=Lutibacter sp. Hel_I_33_5 TaxID=1566289 RepID=UPI0011ACD5CC|nr:hypothetical protein [Lutibacter sp. Hel_I_33_5]TVZ55168.1 hypothetical protein OD91_0412 [Lutibacter sp. Hel_I_33_5]
MDLDTYKKAWENQPKENDTVSKVDIYKMAHSRSSSIVKWIFIISIIEFVVFQCSYFFFDLEKTNKAYEDLNLKSFYKVSLVIGYIILFYFLVKFYLNYKRISVIETTKDLMSKIIKTRRTVKQYVLFNLSYLFIIITVVTIAIVNKGIDGIPHDKIYIFIIGMVIFTIVAIGLFLLIYQLLYGILLRKLKRNHKELAKLEELN